MQQSQLILLHSNQFLVNQRIAGKCVGECLRTLKRIIEHGAPDLTPKVLEGIASGIIADFKCIPTFHLYKGFSGKICVSVNKELVHGIPDNRKLISGDVVKVDLGATFHGAIADAALTAVVGGCQNQKNQELIEICQLSLTNAIAAVKVGKPLGCIGSSINHVVKKTRFGLITQYGGHGISITEDGVGIPHASPFVCNKSQANEGIIIQAGMSLAIEPMLVIGGTETKVLSDGWTVMGNGISAHFEHTIFVHQDKVEVMTLWN